MSDSDFQNIVRKIVSSDSRYDIHAYQFTVDALSFTVQKCQREKNPRGQQHVSGAELIRGMLDFAKEQYGFLAPEVFDFWGIRNGIDAGYIVYNMIHAGLLSASPNDSLQEFDCLWDLPELLRRELKQASDS